MNPEIWFVIFHMLCYVNAGGLFLFTLFCHKAEHFRHFMQLVIFYQALIVLHN